MVRDASLAGMEIVRATSTSEEAKLLHAALADFSPNGARERYAVWLDARGERGRASALRATMAAFAQLDIAPLVNCEGDPHWQRMAGIPLLSMFIRATSKIERNAVTTLRDQLFPRIRPALAMIYTPAESEPAIGASYLWGLPDMQPHEAWPMTGELSDWYSARAEIPQDKHCAFLAQIAFRDMQGTVLGRELPSTGGFAVFSITEATELGIVETLVRPWQCEGQLARRAAPTDLLEDRLGDGMNGPAPTHVMALREILSLPDSATGPFAQEIPGCGFNEPFDRVLSLLEDACWAAEEGFDGVLAFGGYLRGTSGADPSPDAKSLRLAVFRVSPDAGLVHFAIPAEDLARGRLDRVQYVWNDWDS